MQLFRTLGTSLTCALLLTALTACEDPTSVGLDIVEGDGGAPQVVSLPPDGFAPRAVTDVTGNASRVLAGRVDDPLLGAVAADAYIDFTPSTSITDGFRNGTLQRVTLSLVPGYVYGDSTAAVTLRLLDVDAEWSETGATADTAFAASRVVTTFTFAPTDTLVSVALPADWLARQDAVFRGTTFADSFHGFRLEHAAGNAVVGFSAASIEMEATSGDATISYTVNETVTTFARATEPQLGGGRVAVQDGAGPGLGFTLDLAGVSAAELNRAVLALQADTLLTDGNVPAGFARPRLTQLDLLFVDTDGLPVFIDTAVLDASGRFLFGSSNVRGVLRGILLGDIDVERFEVRIPNSRNSLDAVALYDATTGDTAPVIYLTLTPLAD